MTIAGGLGGAAAVAALVAAVAVTGPAGTAGAWPSVVMRLRAAQPLAQGPISYFNTTCANCHGDYGSFYGEEFATNLDDADLRRVVQEMVEGPAQSPLGARDLAALTAYHRSLADRTPFVAWTGVRDGELVGEVTPGSTVTVAFDTGRVASAEVREHHWRAPHEADAAWTEIRAEHDGRITILKRDSAFSHPAPPEDAER